MTPPTRMLRPHSFGMAILLTGLVALGPLSTDLYLPALPTLVRVFETNVSAVQLTLSVYMFGFAAAQLVIGPLSDRFGRRPVLLIGLAVYVIAGVACMFAQTIEQLTIARFIQAMGGSTGPVLGRAIVRDVYSREKAAEIYSYIGMAMALAPAVAPILGGYLTFALGWQACFGILIGLGLGALLAVGALLGETNRHMNPGALDATMLVGNYATLLRDRRFIGYLGCAGFIFAAMFAFISGASFLFIDRLGLSEMAFGLCFTVFVAGFMAGSLFSARRGARIGPDRLIRYGTAIASVGGIIGVAVVAAVGPGVAGILIPVFILMVGCGLVLPNAQAGAIAPYPHIAGSASALMGFGPIGLAAAVGVVVGWLHDDTGLPMMALMAIATCLAAASYWVFLRATAAALAEAE